MTVVSEQATAFLLRWLAVMDSDTPERVLDMLAPDFRLSVLFATEDGVTEFVGGRAELEGYLAQRQPDGQEHHVDTLHRAGDREILTGHTTRHGELLATYVMIAQLDEDERVRALFNARTVRLHFS